MKRIRTAAQEGFTLIELLIVIAILGVLAAGVLIAIDPVDRINSANDSRVQSDIGTAGRAAEAFAATHNGFYPGATAIAAGGDLVTSGDLKTIPVAPSGYTVYTVQTMVGSPPANGACVSGALANPTCTGIAITGQLKSKKYTSASTPVWVYNSTNGKSCAVATGVTVCP